MDLTLEFIENPETPIVNDVNEVFESYGKVLIRYLEMKELEAENGNEHKPENQTFKHFSPIKGTLKSLHNIT